MLTADLAAQRALLQLAETDRLADAAAHQRNSMPELAVIADRGVEAGNLRGRLAIATAEAADLETAADKLDGEIESVRTRAARDQQRLAAGGSTPKEAENLQREIESLARRQSSLEDDALELMERRETADETVSRLREQLGLVDAEIDAATVRRNDAWTTIDDELARLRLQRASLTTGLAADLLAVYDRVRAAGKIAAAVLTGARCGGCAIELDRSALDAVRGAEDDAVPRCPECGALLVRNP